MNAGPPYLFANPNPNSKTPFNTDWNTKDVEFFELYAGPITTRYGEVFWQGLPPVPLPPDIVSRFDNKAMAIVKRIKSFGLMDSLTNLFPSMQSTITITSHG
jgi:hypothetical protein